MASPWRLATRPIWREARLALEVSALLRHPVFRGESVPDGGGQPVLLIPGFLAGDDSLSLMTAWLRGAGYRTERAGIRLNADCGEAVVERLTVRLDELAAREPHRVAIVGQSRGGLIARALAVRRPDLVSGIVTLGSAHLDPFAVHPLVAIQARALGVLGSLGVPGLFKTSCLRGKCCVGVRGALAAPFPAGVGFVSIYSRGDGIVDWRACLDPGAQCEEVDSSHCGMGAHPQAYSLIAAALSGFQSRTSAGSPLTSAPRPTVVGNGRAQAVADGEPSPGDRRSTA
jgi:pimeloyl-ACP methyl ester carboxylesterase